MQGLLRQPRLTLSGRSRSRVQVSSTTERKVDEMQKWEYMVVPMEAAGKLKKKSPAISPETLNELGAEGWEAVGITLKRGDLVAWPVVLLKRPLAA